MAQIIEFVRPDYAFDSEGAAVLVAAYDKAVFGLEGRGAPESVREIIAKRIIALAAGGERNPHKLCEAALATFGISR